MSHCHYFKGCIRNTYEKSHVDVHTHILGGDTNPFVRTGLRVCQIKHAELHMVPALCKHVTQTVNKLN